MITLELRIGGKGPAHFVFNSGLLVPNEARYQTALRPDIIWRVPHCLSRVGRKHPHFPAGIKWIFRT